MRSFPRRRTQRGAALVVGLIMLTLITVIVTSAFTMSSSDLKAVGNLQWRGEAIAAANKAIEQVISSPFTDAPGEQAVDVDINNDGVTDYTVTLAKPTCVDSAQIAGLSAPPSSILLGGAFSVATSDFYETVWDIDATVSDRAGGASGASVRVREGIRVLLTQTQYTAVCGS